MAHLGEPIGQGADTLGSNTLQAVRRFGANYKQQLSDDERRALSQFEGTLEESLVDYNWIIQTGEVSKDQFGGLRIPYASFELVAPDSDPSKPRLVYEAATPHAPRESALANIRESRSPSRHLKSAYWNPDFKTPKVGAKLVVRGTRGAVERYPTQVAAVTYELNEYGSVITRGSAGRQEPDRIVLFTPKIQTYDGLRGEVINAARRAPRP